MTEAYKIGITVAMNNLFLPELTRISAALMGVNRQVKELHSNWAKLGVIAGGVAIGGGIAALASGIGKAMKMDDTVVRSLIALGEPVGPNYMKSGLGKRIESTIFDAATSYGVSMVEAQEAGLQALRALAPLSTQERMELLKPILSFAGAEVLGKHGTTMTEAVEAGIGLAHQLRDYSPEKIEPILGAFAKLSMASPQSLSQMGRATSYYLPLLNGGLGMDPTELMAIGTVGSQMGLATKSGTWLSAMFQAPFVADLTGKRGKERVRALEELGIVSNGKVVTNDPFDFLRIIAERSAKMTPERRMNDFVAAFGQQGARAAAIFTDPTVEQNIAAIAASLKGAKSPEQLKGDYGQSSLVKWEKLKAQLDKDLIELGDTVMPEVLSVVEGITSFFKYLSRIGGGLAKTVFAINEAHNDPNSWLYNKQRSLPQSISFLENKFDLSPPPPKPQQQFLGTTVVKIGEREVGRAATKYLVEGMQTMPSSGSTFDGRMHLQPVQ